MDDVGSGNALVRLEMQRVAQNKKQMKVHGAAALPNRVGNELFGVLSKRSRYGFWQRRYFGTKGQYLRYYKTVADAELRAETTFRKEINLLTFSDIYARSNVIHFISVGAYGASLKLRTKSIGQADVWAKFLARRAVDISLDLQSEDGRVMRVEQSQQEEAQIEPPQPLAESFLETVVGQFENGKRRDDASGGFNIDFGDNAPTVKPAVPSAEIIPKRLTTENVSAHDDVNEQLRPPGTPTHDDVSESEEDEGREYLQLTSGDRPPFGPATLAPPASSDETSAPTVGVDDARSDVPAEKTTLKEPQPAAVARLTPSTQETVSPSTMTAAAFENSDETEELLPRPKKPRDFDDDDEARDHRDTPEANGRRDFVQIDVTKNVPRVTVKDGGEDGGKNGGGGKGVAEDVVNISQVDEHVTTVTGPDATPQLSRPSSFDDRQSCAIS
ncbi:hypothetical protein CTAYLR_004803 [Chrysophaeum taylorii]|uniref:PH domain-containing protein n=1 Tax=Chrysophaeum taylorii TaxID=2483200 RepID=A0AAD7XN04_9STRA|nr:hypothetical protein CTAYLR_004803 [Chrysophaeum taylorii]